MGVFFCREEGFGVTSGQPSLKPWPDSLRELAHRGLENPDVFEMPEVVRAGGLGVLKAIGDAGNVLHETK